jgi:hypothetical protein
VSDTVDKALAALAASTGQQIGDLRTNFQQQFDAARAAGATSDQALEAAIGRVGQQATAGQADITAKLAATDKKLADFAVQTGQGFADVKAGFDAAFKDAQAKGASADAALQAGLDKVGQQAAANQKATDAQLGALGADVTAVKAGLGQLGTQLGQTQSDFNARVVELMRQGQDYQTANLKAQAELKQGQAQLGTQLGAVDTRITDLVKQGQSQQEATGQALRELATGQTGLGQQIGQLGTTLGGQIATTQQQVQQAQRQANMGTLLGLLGGFGGRQAPAPAPAPTPLANIGYVYDIGGRSIFANPQQEKAFVTPYAEGGTVEDLLKILKG